MKIVFWSEEDGCGTTSGMAAIASVCTNVWKMKTILMQTMNQEGDLHLKLGKSKAFVNTTLNTSDKVPVAQEDCTNGRDGWEVLLRQQKNKTLTKASVIKSMIPVVKGQMYYLPQGEYKKQEKYPECVKAGVVQAVCLAEQLSDITFIDCGSGQDEMAKCMLTQADVAVVCISQERQNLDAYFQNRHVFFSNVIYLVNQYHHESIYNKKNLNRLYRLCEEELAVIPNDPVFRHVSGKGKTERFIYAHAKCRNYDHSFYFMQELMQTAAMILKAAGLQYPQMYQQIG